MKAVLAVKVCVRISYSYSLRWYFNLIGGPLAVIDTWLELKVLSQVCESTGHWMLLAVFFIVFDWLKGKTKILQLNQFLFVLPVRRVQSHFVSFRLPYHLYH